METKEIISSGLLELYAAGIASEEEAGNVEQWVIQYPEVAAELAAIRDGIEAYAYSYSIQPGPSVKEKIFARIQSEATVNQETPQLVKEYDEAPVKMQTPFWRMLAAASVLLLVASIVLNVVTYNRYAKADNDLADTTEKLNSLEAHNKMMEEGMSVVQNKYSVPVALKGLEAAPDAAAKIFWIRNTGEVFIDASNLPEAPAGKRYQLWGIVAGKPVDGGMILTTRKGDKYHMQKMNSFGSAEAFAITLEEEKGSPSPQGPMYVMGKM